MIVVFSVEFYYYMPNLISENQKQQFTGAYGSHFSTFSYGKTRLITVTKEPIKTVVSVSNTISPAYGYDDASQETNFTYTVQSGIYPSVIAYNNDQKTNELEEAKNQVGQGRVRLKLEQDARDFIEDGRKTLRIEFDGKAYNTITFDAVHSFLGLKYFIYFVENTL